MENINELYCYVCFSENKTYMGICNDYRHVICFNCYLKVN